MNRASITILVWLVLASLFYSVQLFLIGPPMVQSYLPVIWVTRVNTVGFGIGLDDQYISYYMHEFYYWNNIAERIAPQDGPRTGKQH